MSRSRRRRVNNLVQRNNPLTIAKVPLLRRNVLPLTQIEDKRQFIPRISYIRNSPKVFRPLRTSSARNAKLRYGINLRSPFGFIIHAPRNAVLCVRRKIRREVLFAKGAAGGRSSRKPKRFNQYSHIHC